MEGSASREEAVYMAKLAEQAERCASGLPRAPCGLHA